MTDQMAAHTIAAALKERFGENLMIDPELPGLSTLAALAGHHSHRRFLPRPIAPELLRLLCACALSAPSKSDLQQCDIVVVNDARVRKVIVDTIPDMPWIMDAPAFLMFIGNGARLPLMAKLRAKPFPNDHLDQFFNAAVDAAIVLATFMRAAAAVGLGTCPISAVRDRPLVVSDALRLRSERFRWPGCALAGRPKPAGSRRGWRLPPPSSRTPTMRATLPARSTPTTGGGRRCARTGVSATWRAGAKRSFTAGPKTRRANTPSRRAPILAHLCAARDFASINATMSCGDDCRTSPANL